MDSTTDLIAQMRQTADTIENARAQLTKLQLADTAAALLRVGAKALGDVVGLEANAFRLLEKELYPMIWEHAGPELQERYRQRVRDGDVAVRQIS
jgi:hypothetical protein